MSKTLKTSKERIKALLELSKKHKADPVIVPATTTSEAKVAQKPEPRIVEVKKPIKGELMTTPVTVLDRSTAEAELLEQEKEYRSTTTEVITRRQLVAEMLLQGYTNKNIYEYFVSQNMPITLMTIVSDVRKIQKTWVKANEKDITKKRAISIQKRLKYQRKAFTQARMSECNAIQNDIDKIDGVTPDEPPKIVKLIHMTSEQLDNEIALLEAERQQALVLTD